MVAGGWWKAAAPPLPPATNHYPLTTLPTSLFCLFFPWSGPRSRVDSMHSDREPDEVSPMRLRLLLAAAVALALTAFAPAPFPKPKKKSDLEKMAGTWTALRYHHGTSDVGGT